MRSLCLLFAAVGLASYAIAADFTVTDHGAIGDGRTINTIAIQASIDAAHAAGGGRVVIPAGIFRTGSIFLKTGVELHVVEGATLLGSNVIEDYPKRDTRIEGHFEPWRMALINAEKLDGVRISGRGVIDGNGILFWAAFWQRRKENPDCTNLEVERPRLMFIDRCRDVRVEGISLRDSGFWNIHLYRCQGVLVDGVSITAPFGGTIRGPSTDGIDIDSSQNVTIRRCHIAVADDCIALKGTKGPLAHLDADSPPVENILVEGCTFGDGEGVLTCGSEATVVRDVTVRNCEVSGQNYLVRLKLRPDTPQRYENLLYENIRLSGSGSVFNVAPWTQFFDLKGHPSPVRTITGVTLRNITGHFGSLGRLLGNKGDTLTGVTLENIQLTLADRKFECGTVGSLVVRNVTLNGEAFLP